MRSSFITLIYFVVALKALAQFAPAVGQVGSLAIYKDSSIIKSWASSCVVKRGYKNIADKTQGFVDNGNQQYALGYSNPKVVSLGDSGVATLSFNGVIKNGKGPDFCVFENSFNDDFLELAHVEVSSNGIDFVRFPSFSNVSLQQQKGSFDLIDPTLLYNLAGKYRGQYGTPFDLSDIKDTNLINLDSITHIRIVDVIGSIDSAIGSVDSRNMIINDPYPTDFQNQGFYTGGFDLDAIGLINYEGEIYLNKPSVYFHQAFKFYPNPSHNILNISAENLLLIVEVYDLQGTKIISEQTIYSNNRIDVSFLKSGTYLLVGIFEDYRVVERFVKE